MSRKFLVFTALFALGFLSCEAAHAQILSSFFGRFQTVERPTPQTIPTLVEESDLVAAAAVRQEMLKSQGKTLNFAANPIIPASYSPKTDFISGDDRQITIECRLLTTTPEMIAPYGLTPEYGWQFVPNPQEPLRINERLEKGEGTVGTMNILETYTPTLFRFIGEKNAGELCQRTQGDTRANLLIAPKITLFNGQSGTISDQSQKTYRAGISGHPTDYETLNEGIFMEFAVEIQGDSSVFMKQCNILIRKITRTDVFPLVSGEDDSSLLPGEEVLFIPRLQTHAIKMPVRIPEGKSLLVLTGMISEVEKTENNGFFGKKVSREKLITCVMITPRILPESLE